MASGQDSPQTSKGKKSNRRKKNNAKANSNGEIPNLEEEKKPVGLEEEDEEVDAGGTELRKAPNGLAEDLDGEQTRDRTPVSEPAGGNNIHERHVADTAPSNEPKLVQQPVTNGVSQSEIHDNKIFEMQTRLDELSKDRQQLQAEVTNLRKSLEEIQQKHEEDLSDLRSQLEEAQSGKEHAETQYRNLLGKVNTIRSQLGERLKADAEEISQAKSQIKALEEENESLKGNNDTVMSQMAALREQNESKAKELSTLRERTNLSQQNWLEERAELIRRESVAREEFEATKQAMQDWEVLAMEERSIRESLTERAVELEEQLSAQKEAFEKAAAERDSQSLTVDGLQRALKDIQDARKHELRELVESSQAQVENLRKQLLESEKRASDAETALEGTKRELEKALPFEKEVKEKTLLIGKLRHEAVILNDHLTKALRFLRKGKPEDNIDRHIVTNHFLHFLALDRADPKKFQVLQLIAALLNWTDEQREQAGLARPGGSNNLLRAPMSPFHRTPSTPTMHSEFFPENSSRKESLAELWSNFLEQEAQQESSPSRVPSPLSTPKPPP